MEEENTNICTVHFVGLKHLLIYRFALTRLQDTKRETKQEQSQVIFLFKHSLFSKYIYIFLLSLSLSFPLHSYYANGLLLLYLWVLPHNAQLFQVVFCVINGPLMVAVPIFRNSLVSHDQSGKPVS